MRVAVRATETGEPDSKLMALLYRPAIEPILILRGPGLVAKKPTIFDVLAVASMLTGKPCAVRTQRCYADGNGGRVEFAPPDLIREWLPSVHGATQSSHSHLNMGLTTFAATIILHPLVDGNGRLARFLLHAMLAAKIGIWPLPLAIAPAFYRRRDELAAVIATLSISGAWNPYYSLLCEIVDEACTIAVDDLTVAKG